jgi:hypothetical protein
VEKVKACILRITGNRPLIFRKSAREIPDVFMTVFNGFQTDSSLIAF